ncbi:MAG: hypothetical protein ACLGH0_15770, partial [Thermoanaerobaculia bacterium]
MRTLIVLFALATAYPAAARLAFHTVHKGEPLPGSELCFSRIDPKAPSPILKYFSGAPIRCMSADLVYDVPLGKWTYFARNPRGYVSRHRVLFSYAGGPENTYSGSEMEMDEAAYVDFADVQLEAGERAYAVVGPTSERLQLVIPLLDGEATVMVPPNAVVIPVIAQPGSISRVGTPMKLGATELRKARFDGGGRTIIAWSKVDAGTPMERFKTLRDIAAPEVVVTTAKGEELQPVYPIVWGHDTQETMQFFVNVPPGDVRVTLRGDAWTGATVVAHGDGTVV